MTVFDHYARYYDLLYRDKDYAAEADFVDSLIQTHFPQAQSILELGCGTANHAALLAKKGYSIYGIDQSATMLQRGQDRLAQLPDSIQQEITLAQGDIRDIRLNQKFDVVISLFHVVSYQTTNEDLIATFATVKEHLNPDGIFIFDCWYGPAVLHNLPSVRVKRLEDELIQVTRIAEPTLKFDLNSVDVQYTIFIENKLNKFRESKEEIHSMRYFFTPELRKFLGEQNLEIKHHGDWLDDEQLGLNSWSAYYVSK